MLKKLTKKEQMALLKALPMHRIKVVEKLCKQCENQSGTGIMSLLSSVGKAIGPIAHEISPVVMKEFVKPFLKKKGTQVAKIATKKVKDQLGLGLNLPGSGLSLPGGALSPAGGALKLAGQGASKKRGRPRKKK